MVGALVTIVAFCFFGYWALAGAAHGAMTIANKALGDVNKAPVTRPTYDCVDCNVNSVGVAGGSCEACSAGWDY